MMIVKLVYFSLFLSLVECRDTIFGIPADAFKTIPELIGSFGYSNEIHHIQTDDGYIITAFRISSPNNVGKAKGQPVLFSHSMTSSSADYIIQGPGKAIGLLLADRNYDVWIMNYRGTRYSQNHTSIPVSDSKFWNFSTQEIGCHDLPNSIDHVLKISGYAKLIHLGYSQGTIAFYTMMSEKPQYNSKVKLHISFSPAPFLCHIKHAFIKLLAMPEKLGLFSSLLERIGHFNLTPQMPFLPVVFRVLCVVDNKITPMCTEFLSVALNANIRSDMASELMIIAGVFPAGASSKSILHVLQNTNNCGFRKYVVGFGLGESYNLKNVKVPIYTYYGTTDNLVSPEDVLDLERALNTSKVFIPVPNFGHVDFISNPDATEQIYLPAIKVIDSYV